jgi:hypothetical protein
MKLDKDEQQALRSILGEIVDRGYDLTPAQQQLQRRLQGEIPNVGDEATISFGAEAYDTAAMFFALLSPGRGQMLSQPVPNSEQGFSVTVIPRDGGEPFDAELRGVDVDRDGQYILVVWEWDEDRGRGDRSKVRRLNIYDDIERVVVL